MKKLILTLLLGISSLSLSAMVGEQFQSFVAKYGQPDEFDQRERRARWENHKDGYVIIAFFDRDGTSGFESYTSMIDGVSDTSIMRRSELLDRFGKEIPNLQYAKFSPGETRDFGGYQLRATADDDVALSVISTAGRLAVVSQRELRGAGARLIVFREGFARNMIHRMDRNTKK